MSRTGFPFSAVVGMEDLRLALVLNAVSPAVGGVLVRGEKGTAKSTMVRALATVLPGVTVVAGCRFSCDPAAPESDCPDGPHEREVPATGRPARLVELPVGASEDRLVGALDIERALIEGIKAYEPGLLADAHRGVLYVDEVNLLHDHLVDLLLDAAALGTCYVEREGVSVRHPARFLLVGTMNPEEGELRPQLLDRFGLSVEAAAPADPAMRAEVIRRRLAYDSDPAAFTAHWAPAEAAFAERIVTARERVARVVLPDSALRQVTAVCTAFGVDGLRADLVTARAAIAHAAWEERAEVTAEDIRAAARLALPHRRRRHPFDAPGIAEEELDRAMADAIGDGPDEDGPDDGSPSGSGHDGSGHDGSGHDGSGHDGSGIGDRGSGGSTGTGSPGASGRQAGGQTRSDARGRGADGHVGPDGYQAGGQHRPAVARRASPASGDDGAEDGPAAVPDPVFRVRLLDVPRAGAGAPGRRSRARASCGRVTGTRIPRERPTRIHLAATLAAAAPHQRARGRAAPGPLLLRRTDIREPELEGREGNLVLFVVDASGSMAARSRMGAVKGAVLSLLMDAYQRRDKVGMVTFRGSGAQVVLPPTSSVEAAAARLAALPTGGRTPLAAGLVRAAEVLRTERLRDPQRRPLLVVVTDGRATAGPDPVGDAHRAAGLLAATGSTSVVVDCEVGPTLLGLAGSLAAALGGLVLRPAELAAGQLAESVRVLRRAA